MADQWLTGPACATRIGVKPNTWRSYVRNGYAPPADDPGDPNAHPRRRTPRWKLATFQAWQATRPGRGARTDLTPR